MSETLASEKAGIDLLALQATSLPKSQLLKSFNIFKVAYPQQLLRDYTKKCGPDVPQDLVSISDDSQGFEGTYTEQSYSRDVQKALSVSVGIEGKYGVFSASLNTDYSRSEHTTNTSLYSSYSAKLDIGTATYIGSRAEILNLLDPSFASELKAIDSLKKAKEFTDKWGTHLITRVNLGGQLFVSIAAETSTKEEKEKLAVTLKAKYNGAGSLSTAVSVISETAQTQTSKSFTQRVYAVGGSANKAAAIDGKDKQTMLDWVGTCTVDTAFKIGDTVEIYMLVDGNAHTQLKQYIDLTMLAHSLKNPTVFIKQQNITAYNTNTVTAPGINTEYYKIIGGGATTSPGSSSYLVGCYPQLSGNRPAGWHAVSHDIEIAASPLDVLSAYAVAIFDPEDIIDVTVATADSPNTKIGMSSSTANLPANEGWILTCGGTNSETKKGANKMIVASHYTDDKKGWIGTETDYLVASTDIKQTTYAVGIKSKNSNLLIEANYITGPQTRSQHGRNTADAQTPVCGGGIRVSDTEGQGNLVQRNYPSSATAWTGTNDDMAGNISHANSRAYAITLNARVKTD